MSDDGDEDKSQAGGMHGNILKWFTNGLSDVAVGTLSSDVAAGTLSAPQETRERKNSTYQNFGSTPLKIKLAKL